MAQLWQDVLGGLVSDDPLTSGATTLNSPGLSEMVAISGDYMFITLDPDGIHGAPEIAKVTAHTASATSATIARGERGTTGREHPKSVVWVAGFYADDLPTVTISEPTDGVTRASSTYGALSTAWTGAVTVEANQYVDITVTAAMTCSADEVMYLALRRGATTIYENVHYTGAPNSQANVITHTWTDTSPGTGSVTYEVYVASASAGTITVRNGATLDTTIEATQGKSVMRLVARSA